jgi:hypothetical protein
MSVVWAVDHSRALVIEARSKGFPCYNERQRQRNQQHHCDDRAEHQRDHDNVGERSGREAWRRRRITTDA